ncbi:hypothetical protein HMI55_005234 [Coelomomyces lativittatus]|nr:hypothetical protein HMI55_005234 [Coelomomyces lativittatus]
MDILTRFQPIERPIKAAFSSIFLESLFKMETPILFPSFKEHEYKKFMINYLTYGRLNFNQKYPNRYVLIFNLLQFASGLKQTSYTYDSIHTGLKMLQYLLMVEIKIQEEEFNIKYFMPQYLNLESKFEGTWDLFSMRPLVIDEPMRDRNWYGEFPSLNIAVYDHHYVPLPEKLARYLEGYRRLINYRSFQPLIHMRFPGRYLMDKNAEVIESFEELQSTPEERSSGSYIFDVILENIKKLSEHELFKLNDILTNDFMNSEPSGM